MSIGKKIALMLVGIFGLTLLATGIYMFTAYNFSTSELAKTFKSYRDQESTAIADSKPFSVLLMGVDTGSGSRSNPWEGNSDTMILVTVNPETKSTTVTSLERDILVAILDEKGQTVGNENKLNSAYATGGAPMAIKTIEGLLDLKIDYYMQLNMQGLVDLVDAVGGITVTNEFDFPIRIDEWEPEYTASIEPGTYKVNGDQALVFARMRYDDPEGDYGRQKRQRDVIQKILKKLLALDSLSSYRRILKAVTKNMQTDIAINSSTIPSLLAYRSALANLKTYQLHGENAELEDGSYQAVTQEHLLETQNRIKRELGLEEKQELTTTALLYEDLFGLDKPISSRHSTDEVAEDEPVDGTEGLDDQSVQVQQEDVVPQVEVTVPVEPQTPASTTVPSSQPATETSAAPPAPVTTPTETSTPPSQ